jgi:hypothetical protein
MRCVGSTMAAGRGSSERPHRLQPRPGRHDPRRAVPRSARIGTRDRDQRRGRSRQLPDHGRFPRSALTATRGVGPTTLADPPSTRSSRRSRRPAAVDEGAAQPRADADAVMWRLMLGSGGRGAEPHEPVVSARFWGRPVRRSGSVALLELLEGGWVPAGEAIQRGSASTACISAASEGGNRAKTSRSVVSRSACSGGPAFNESSCDLHCRVSSCRWPGRARAAPRQDPSPTCGVTARPGRPPRSRPGGRRGRPAPGRPSWPSR